MINTQRNSQGNGARFIIRPNSSLTWKQGLFAYSMLAIFCISVAGWFAFRGFWLILPFAGLEVLALALTFYLCMRRCTKIEVIGLNADTLYIEKGWHKPDQRYEFKTAWIKIELVKAIYRGHPSVLKISSSGRSVIIGADLNEDERIQLRNKLEKAIAAFR